MAAGKRTLIVSFEVEERAADGSVTYSEHVHFELPGSDDSMLNGMKAMMQQMRGMEMILAAVKKEMGI